MKPWLSRTGQIVMPALLLFPALILFVYLIFETAKLSREKIRHQFALDAAAFVEATNYSDFLNRTAYINGPFPMRIFSEGYDDFEANCEGKWAGCEEAKKAGKNYYSQILYDNGVFPRSASGVKVFTEKTDTDSWDIRYGGKWDKNVADPDFSGDHDTVELFTQDNTNKYWHSEDVANEIAKLYIQVFALLGSVEDAQSQVLAKLSSGHSFLKKSYWLNTGEESDTLADEFQGQLDRLGGFKSKTHCIHYYKYYANKWVGGVGLQQYRVMGFGVDPKEKIPVESPGCSDDGGGLFQLETVSPTLITGLSSRNGDNNYPGLSLSIPWQFPRENYFNVDFVNLRQALADSDVKMAMDDRQKNTPELHTTVSIGVKVDPNKPGPSVWPDPTPKFQVREFP